MASEKGKLGSSQKCFYQAFVGETWDIGDQLCSTDNPRKTALCDSPFGDRYETSVFGEMKLQKELDLMFVHPGWDEDQQGVE